MLFTHPPIRMDALGGQGSVTCIHRSTSSTRTGAQTSKWNECMSQGWVQMPSNKVFATSAFISVLSYSASSSLPKLPWTSCNSPCLLTRLFPFWVLALALSTALIPGLFPIPRSTSLQMACLTLPSGVSWNVISSKRGPPELPQHP